MNGHFLPNESQMERVANAIEIIASNNVKQVTGWQDIDDIVKSGAYKSLLPVGTTINDKHNDNGTQRDTGYVVMSHETCTTEDGREAEAVVIGLEYLIPHGMPFCTRQAFYYCEEELPAGTYYITMMDNWGTNVKAGKSYQFTLTQPVPAGGQLSGFESCPDQAPSNWRVKSHTSNTDAGSIETAVVTEGASGELLGAFGVKTTTLNSIHYVGYGSNDYELSDIRQWLNSDKPANQWWKPTSVYSRPPAEAATKAGFLASLPEGLRKIISPVKIATHKNTAVNASTVQPSITTDLVSLPSLEEMFINIQASGEGNYFDYFKRLGGRDTRYAHYSTYPELKNFGMENKAAAQHCWLRSAFRGYGSFPWYVNSSGSVYSYNACDAFRAQPVVRILKSR